MLHSLRDFQHYKVSAVDGEVGKVVDFLLDDAKWTIRYLVVETGGLLRRNQVLISPQAILRVDRSTERFELALTKDRVENSPDVDTHKPVGRQKEEELYIYYGYPRYWGYADTWAAGASAVAVAEGPLLHPEPTLPEDVHLRSATEVHGYDIQARDDSIGEVDDFIVEENGWVIRYVVIDTSKWWFGKKVLVAPQWASRISWEEQNVYVDLSRQTIKNSPEWDPSLVVNRGYERRLHQHYHRPPYWDDGVLDEASAQESARSARDSVG